MSLENGKSLYEKGDKQTAFWEFVKALNEDFNNGEALFYAGTCLLELGMNGAAASFLARALQCKPGNPDMLLNLGAAYKKEENWAGAEEIWQMAYEEFEKKNDPSSMAGTLSNVGTIYVNNGEVEQSIRFFDRALEIEPGNLDALANRCMAYLWMGRWKEGWEHYDEHMKLGTRIRRPYINKALGTTLPEWDGSPGKKPVLYGEQGIGDEIQFGSMIPDVLKLCPDAVFDCHPRLEKTWKRSFPIACYGTRKTANVGEWFVKEMPDCAIAVGSLGKFFRNDAKDFPGTPYLKPDAVLLTQFNAQRRGKPRIGISWAGGSKKTGRKVRSIPLGDFVPMLTTVDADWFSLQYTDPAGREVDQLEMETGIHVRHFPDLVQHTDYDRTVAFVASLDLVITCCTSILHVAGALGVPCWIMTPYESAWRESGNDGNRGPAMPWYASAKLFHRTKDEQSWVPTIERVRTELADHFGIQRTESVAAQ